MNVYTELWGNARSAAGGRESEGLSRTTPKRCQWQKKRGVVEEAAGELRAKASKATNAATVSRSGTIGATEQGAGIVMPRRWATKREAEI